MNRQRGGKRRREMKLALRTISHLNDQSPRLLGALCLAILLIILVAGLWPFNFLASNQVAWLPDQNGVHFYGQGIIVSSEVLNKERKPLFPDKSITLEIRASPTSGHGQSPPYPDPLRRQSTRYLFCRTVEIPPDHPKQNG